MKEKSISATCGLRLGTDGGGGSGSDGLTPLAVMVTSESEMVPSVDGEIKSEGSKGQRLIIFLPMREANAVVGILARDMS